MKKIYIAGLIFFCMKIQAQDIASARQQTLGATVTITGIVTNGPELGVIRYIEDITAGIALYDQTTNNYLANITRGDSITITGTLADYNGLLEVYVTGFPIIHSNNNILPTPQLLTPSQIGEPTESELLQIDNVIFNAGGGFFAVGSYDFNSSGQQGTIYIRTNHPLLGSFIPVGPVTLVGISSQYTFSVPANDGYQLLPRDSADIILSGNIVLTSAVLQTNITTTSFDLTWSTSDSATTNANYGLTANLGSLLTFPTNTTTHTISLTGLQPATFYNVQCYSVKGLDTAFSSLGIYSTESNSSGIIRPYFNHTVDVSFSTGTDAQNISTYFNDTIKAYIDLAQNTLDICVYNASDATLADAINDAYNRGVQVRYIADDDVVNSMLNDLDPNIPIVYRDPNTAGIMHNKFIIIDVNSINNSWIMGGSCNWTNPSNLFNDYNNIIFIQDQALAKAYTLEFEEMWAGNFGTHKLDNTPHKFLINSKEVELYFSPSDQTTSKILNTISNVDYSFEFALLSFTKDDIGSAIIDKDAEFGVSIRGILEDQNVNGSEYDALIDAGVNIKSHAGITHQIHHKYAIADANIVASDPTVLTGSHNWSNNAENNSDENTLIIHDATIANIYLQEFEKRWGEISNSNFVNSQMELDLITYPNPSTSKINIHTQLDIFNINIYKIDGTLINSRKEKSIEINEKGVYFIKVITDKGSTLRKVIIQ